MATEEQFNSAVEQIGRVLTARHEYKKAERNTDAAAAAYAAAVIGTLEEAQRSDATFTADESEAIYRTAAEEQGFEWDDEEFDSYRKLFARRRQPRIDSSLN